MRDNIVNIEESINNKYKNIKFEGNRGKGYSMDELKILNYLHENYFPEDSTFRFAGSGGQQVMRNLKDPKNIPGYKPIMLSV